MNQVGRFKNKAEEWAVSADAAGTAEIGQARATLSIAYSLLAIVAVLLEDRERLVPSTATETS